MINAGLRYFYFHKGNIGYNSFDPRILENIPLRHYLAIKYSFLQMLQYIDLLAILVRNAIKLLDAVNRIYQAFTLKAKQSRTGKTFDDGNYELSVES